MTCKSLIYLENKNYGVHFSHGWIHEYINANKGILFT